MNRHDLDTLIQDVLDGTASPEAQARLERAMAADPAVRERRQEMEQVFEKLREVEREEAPAGLRSAVLDRLRAPAARERAPGLGRARHSQGARGGLRLALPFALGFAAGAIAFVGWRGVPSPDLESAVAGSMMPADGTVERWREGRLSVTLRGERQGDLQILGLRAESSGPGTEIELRFDVARTRLAGFRQSQARVEGVEIAADHVILRPVPGSEYRLELMQRDGGAPVVVTSRSDASSSVRTLAADFGTREDR